MLRCLRAGQATEMAVIRLANVVPAQSVLRRLLLSEQLQLLFARSDQSSYELFCVLPAMIVHSLA